MSTPVAIIIIVVCAVIFCIAGFVLGSVMRQKANEKEIGSATQEATKIINDALQQAEHTKKASLIEAKDEIHKLRSDADKEIRERRSEVQKQENRLNQREEYLDKRADSIEAKNESLSQKLKDADDKLLEIDSIKKSQFDMLEKISGFTQEEAKHQLLASLEEELDTEKSRKILEYEQMVRDQSEVLAKEIIATAIQRCAADHTAETTVSVVSLPSDDMKGRIIGREGRNIRSIETITGVELIIDDTPEAITVSSFDPVRREIARLTLERLIQDGRIHPTKIEEMFEKSTREVNAIIKQEGEKAVLAANCGPVHPELVKLLGKLRYRTSYGQNVLKHSLEVSYIAGLMAAELGANEKLARRAGLLHDIGKALDHEMEGSHIALGVEYARKYKESEEVIHAIEAHHGDVECKTIVACLVQAADAVSAARPGARRENIENYIKRLQQLEEISTSFPGVERAYAIQAGREIRVMVSPEAVNDERMPYIAHEIAKKIESEMEYPGQIKVNIIRESRVSAVAK
ncbi:MAG: ribonuclease Y [Clostridiales bacterium]|jgi:ribonuclease Y|uniref:ribonuclease Y n=1 Tax=Eubacterium sp. TaxID=142586 RepID=UPI001D7EA3B8|nr:ribonuclease Y [Clostridiales bacterium]MBD8980398.1 ribonuclease Y [Clostridiales bacterium]